MFRRALLPACLVAATTAVQGCTSEIAERPAVDDAPLVVDSAVLAAMPPGTTPEVLREGRRLYAVCSTCHGVAGEGTQLGPPLTGPEWIHIDGAPEEIRSSIQRGVPSPARYPVPMPPMGGGDFDDDELDAVTLYVHLLGLDVF